MKATIILSIYQNVENLAAILRSLRRQTEQDFELIISEDGASEQVAEFLAAQQLPWPVQHLTQEDNGWRKNRALNRAVVAAKADWLIFVDGDCVLHPRFVEMHVRHRAEGVILAGKRVKLNPELSRKLLNNKKLRLLPYLFWRRGCRYVEEAFFIPLASIFRRKVRHVVGSNMSMSRAALLAINGFDENYRLPAVGEDYDIEWRLLAKGYRLVSLRNLAVQYHIYHKENWHDQRENMEYCRQCKEQNKVICSNGIEKL